MTRVLAILLLSLVARLASAAPAPEPNGRLLYFRYCAECHGTNAVGDGPLATELRTKPANLRHGGALSRHGDDELVAWVREGKRLRLELRPEALRERTRDVEAIYGFLRRLPSIDWATVETGEAIYIERCVPCHELYGHPAPQPATGVTRPPRDLSDPQFQRATSDRELLDLLRHGKRSMPGLVPRLSNDEARALVPYVRLLSPGYRLYDLYCMRCHGAYGEGATGLVVDSGAPEVTFDAAYFRKRTPDEIRTAIWRMLREKSNQMPHFADLMNDAEVRAVMGYLRSLP